MKAGGPRCRNSNNEMIETGNRDSTIDVLNTGRDSNTIADGGTAWAGSQKLKMFGNWGWEWNAAGVLQEFPSVEGDLWELDAHTMHNSGNPLIGGNFTSRVMFFEDRYAGTWQHNQIGGHMFGMIEQDEDADTAEE